MCNRCLWSSAQAFWNILNGCDANPDVASVALTCVLPSGSCVAEGSCATWVARFINHRIRLSVRLISCMTVFIVNKNMRWIYLALVCVMLASPGLGHDSQEYSEFQLREDMMQLQMALWELLQQLEYANEQLRLRVYEDIGHILAEIKAKAIEIMELDAEIHGKDPHGVDPG